MILSMYKYAVLGLAAEREAFLARLQATGVAHLILPPEPAQPGELLRELQRVGETRRFLARHQAAAAAAAQAASYQEICRRREELNQEEQRLQTELGALRKDRAQLAEWGDPNPVELELLREHGLTIAFYRVPPRVFAELAPDEALVAVVQDTPEQVAFVVFSRAPLGLGVPEERLPGLSPFELDQEIGARRDRLAAIQAEYAELAASLARLNQAERELKDQAAYREALLNLEAGLEGRLFVARFWSPFPEAEVRSRLGEGLTLAYEVEEAAEGDRVPVLLKNPPATASGEDLVNIYSIPNHTDFDPSGWVLYWFAAFFGMILGDAGYGLALLGFTVFIQRKVKSGSELRTRMLRLMYLLSGATIFFGVIGASYFGLALAPENPLNRVLLMDFATKEGQNQIMLFSILIGMVHISLALAIKVRRQRDWPSLGWILAMWSGYFLAKAVMTGGEPSEPAKWVLVAGLGLVVLFTSQAKNPIVRLLGGLNGLLGAVQVFSDVLSYLRLFALGIATVYMSQTFNMLADGISGSVPVVGYVLAALVLLTGHLINFLLGIMGGVIHGLRLNFLEWYRWCFEGDGLPFKPFRLSSKQPR